jgi:nitric oxide reductase subunit C
MPQQTPQEKPPAALFSSAYTALSWGSLALMAVILTWLVGTLFVNTRPGTDTSEALAAAEPTLVALAPLAGGGGGCPLLEIPAVCAACHTVAGTSAAGEIGPELTYIRSVAVERIESPLYTGSATTAEEYVRESIMDPSAFVVPSEPGATYSTPSGSSVMQAATGQALDPLELEALIKSLSCSEEEAEE